MNEYEVDYTFAVEKQPDELKGELGLDLEVFENSQKPSFATYVVTVYVEADTPEDAARAVTEKLAEYGDDCNIKVRESGWMETNPPNETGGWFPDDYNLLDVDFPSTRLYPEKVEALRQEVRRGRTPSTSPGPTPHLNNHKEERRRRSRWRRSRPVMIRD